jgi:hypothetical protein
VVKWAYHLFYVVNLCNPDLKLVLLVNRKRDLFTVGTDKVMYYNGLKWIRS